MAKRKKQQQPKKSFFDDLSPQTRQAIGAVGFVVLGIFLTLSLFGYADKVGVWTNAALRFLFGGGAYLSPFLCAFYVYALLNPKDNEEVSASKIVGIALLFLTSLASLALYEKGLGGITGAALQVPLTYLAGSIAAGFIIGAVWLIGLFLTFNTGLLFARKPKVKEEEFEDIEKIALPKEILDELDETENEEAQEDEKEEKKSRNPILPKFGAPKEADFAVSNFVGKYAPPPLTLLQKDKGKAKVGDIKANANIIKRTLKNFNIDVEMDEVSIGPSVTRYALKPAEGVRISKIVGLQNNIELALAASPIRIEAPIPGKSLVGIEVPNQQKAMVGLASLLMSPEYTDSPKPLLVALGRDITGKVQFANVAKDAACAYCRNYRFRKVSYDPHNRHLPSLPQLA
jgi:DNA segregation ATPase FtsK/SpoIIIE, S-DNA-T family